MFFELNITTLNKSKDIHVKFLNVFSSLPNLIKVFFIYFCLSFFLL